jgi:hypothetical protein
MDESFQSALEKVNYGRYINQIQDELKRAMADIGTGKTPGEIERTQTRLEELLRKQAKELAREVGLTGSYVLVFMTAVAVIATAWVSFTLRRGTSDMSRSPEERLVTVELLDALNLALGQVIESATKFADTYPAPPRESAPPSNG